MSEPRVVLNRTGLIQLSAGMVALLALGFLAGAVVGYGVRVDPALQAAAEGLSIAANGEPMTCLPAESTPRMARAEDDAASNASAEVASGEIPMDDESRGAEVDGVADLDRINLNRARSRRAEAEPASRAAGSAETIDAFAESLSPRSSLVDGATPVVRGRYAVQLGVFGVEANADRFASGLRGRGYDPLVVAARNRSGQWMKRVHLQLFDNEASALAAAETFTTREGLPAVVVPFEEGER